MPRRVTRSVVTTSDDPHQPQRLHPRRQRGRLHAEQLRGTARPLDLSVRSPERGADVVRFQLSYLGVGQDPPRARGRLTRWWLRALTHRASSITSRPPPAVIMARSMTYWSSRTFPGQSYR